MMPAPTFSGSVPKTLDLLRDLRINHIVSLVEDDEAWRLGLEKLAPECSTRDIQLHKLPIVDRKVPASIKQFARLSSDCYQFISSGESVAVHCKSGIGRSGMLICSLLGKLGFGMTEALTTIRNKRGLEAPNTIEQLEWLEENWEVLSATAETP